MSITHASHVQAGLSLLFDPHERPDAAAICAVLETCQARADVVSQVDGKAELVASGLTFECDGLAPTAPIHAVLPVTRYGFDDTNNLAGLVASRLYPGLHLSGGLALAPVTRCLLALAAEFAVSLPVKAVGWHPADTLIAPRKFSRSVLAWLAGGAFPSEGLVALTPQADGSVTSRGLAHFIGQELILRGDPGEASETKLRLAAWIQDHLVRTGPLDRYAQWTASGVTLFAEPALQARQVLVWREPALQDH